VLIALKITSISTDLQNHMLQASTVSEDSIGTLRWKTEERKTSSDVKTMYSVIS